MDSTERYNAIWSAKFAEFTARGFPEDTARLMATEAAAAQILGEARIKLGRPVPAEARKIRMAKGDAIGLIVMGGISLLIGVFSQDALNGIVGALICFIGGVEFMGYRRYIEGRPKARECLVGSQLALLLIIWAYCGWHLLGPKTAVSKTEMDALNELGADASEIAGATAGIEHMMYLAVAGISLLYQGGLASYYWRKTGKPS